MPRTFTGLPSYSLTPTTSQPFAVGSVFIAVVSTNPATLLGYGTWSAIATGRVLVGLDSGDTDFDTVEETGGEKTHTLITSEMPAHIHSEKGVSIVGASTRMRNTAAGDTTDIDTSSTTGSTGGDGAHNNVQPYFIVFMWKRIS